MGRKGIYDFVITEVGGTVGDIESLPYVEAIRQLKWQKGKDCLTIHLTLLPYLSTTGELKTKPTQHSVKELLSLGVQPDILVCRTEHPMQQGHEGEDRLVLQRGCPRRDRKPRCGHDLRRAHADAGGRIGRSGTARSSAWRTLRKPTSRNGRTSCAATRNPTSEVHIGLVGKYVELKDAYKSIKEALDHGGAANETKVHIKWVHSEKLTPKNVAKHLSGLSGILVAPGFGHRGIEGKIEAIKFARENKIPFLGHLPGHAVCGDRIRTQRARVRRCQQHRDGRRTPRIR